MEYCQHASHVDLSEHVDVLVVGAGLAGVCASAKLSAKNINYAVVDELPAAGGVWFTSHFPGVRCDVPKSVYSFSFAPHDGDTTHPGQENICDYINQIIDQHAERGRFIFSTRIASLSYRPDKFLWELSAQSNHLTTTQFPVKTATYVILAIGQLSVASTPAIPGLETFSGEIVHSSTWNPSLTVSGKRVAVVGNGASGLQVIETVAPDVAKLVSIQRTPVWVVPRNQQYYPLWANPSCVQSLMRCVRRWLYAKERADWYPMLERGIDRAIFQPSTPLGKEQAEAFTAFALSFMKSQCPQLEELDLVPTYPIGTKRVAMSDFYLTRFNLPHVHAVRGSIQQISGNTLRIGAKDGGFLEHDVDVLVFATGFQTNNFVPRIPVHGLGLSISQAWQDEPQHYWGIAAGPRFPNLFFMQGPGSGGNTHPFTDSMEFQMNMIMKIIVECAHRNAREVSATADSVAAYMSWHNAKLADSVYSTGGVTSWYKTGGHGLVTGVIPCPFPELQKKADQEFTFGHFNWK